MIAEVEGVVGAVAGDGGLLLSAVAGAGVPLLLLFAGAASFSVLFSERESPAAGESFACAGVLLFAGASASRPVLFPRR